VQQPRGFGPDELDLARIARELFAEEHALVWAAHQVERWAQRLAEERCDDPPPRDEVLANVRNALEHLDEADLEGGHAVPGFSGNRSLRKLPGSRLELYTGYNGLAFGLIDPDELERRALGVVAAIEDELMEAAADWWADMSSGRLPVIPLAILGRRWAQRGSWVRPGHIGGTSARDLPRSIENCRDLNRRSDGVRRESAEVSRTQAQDPAYRPTRLQALAHSFVGDNLLRRSKAVDSGR
jgi:hypothetical protein